MPPPPQPTATGRPAFRDVTNATIMPPKVIKPGAAKPLEASTATARQTPTLTTALRQPSTAKVRRAGGHCVAPTNPFVANSCLVRRVFARVSTTTQPVAPAARVSDSENVPPPAAAPAARPLSSLSVFEVRLPRTRAARRRASTHA